MSNFPGNGLDYNFALTDVAEFIKEKKKRGWNDADIIDALEAVGRDAQTKINKLLEEMNRHFKKED
jgi:hypothetical protein